MSFVTAAVNVVAVPAVTLAVLFVMLTATVLVVCDVPLHPNVTITHAAIANASPILEIRRYIECLLVPRRSRFPPREFMRAENDETGRGSIQLVVKHD
jgi:hypothetical protein